MFWATPSNASENLFFFELLKCWNFYREISSVFRFRKNHCESSLCIVRRSWMSQYWYQFLLKTDCFSIIKIKSLDELHLPLFLGLFGFFAHITNILAVGKYSLKCMKINFFAVANLRNTIKLCFKNKIVKALWYIFRFFCLVELR